MFFCLNILANADFLIISSVISDLVPSYRLADIRIFRRPSSGLSAFVTPPPNIGIDTKIIKFDFIVTDVHVYDHAEASAAKLDAILQTKKNTFSGVSNLVNY